MTQPTHTQVRLKRGNAEQVTWIPTQFAVVGKYIRLDECISDDSSATRVVASSDGWLVVGVGAAGVPADRLCYGWDLWGPQHAVQRPRKRARR